MSQDTRAALIEAAGEIFAEQGYRQARVRDIANRAGVNLAAINYHFGSKQGLYQATLDALAGDMVRRFPVADPAVEDRNAEERLHAGVNNLLVRFVDADLLMPRLLAREIAHPTPALDHLVEHFGKPQIGQLAAIVGELLGPRASGEQVRLSTLSIGGQCLFYLLARPIVERVSPESYSEGALGRLTDHITTFSLSALTGLRRRLETESR